MRIKERELLDVTESMTVTDCAQCGVVFALPTTYVSRRRDDGLTFYCPNGHLLSYTGGDKKRIRDLEANLEFVRGQRDGQERRAEAALRSLSATKGVVTKLKKRAAAGICPCCNRHFDALESHMEAMKDVERLYPRIPLDAFALAALDALDMADFEPSLEDVLIQRGVMRATLEFLPAMNGHQRRVTFRVGDGSSFGEFGTGPTIDAAIRAAVAVAKKGEKPHNHGEI